MKQKSEAFNNFKRVKNTGGESNSEKDKEASYWYWSGILLTKVNFVL